MRITLSVLLATLTIYCDSSVLSLPPSLIAKAASSARHHASQIRDKRGSVPAAAAAAADTDNLLQQLNALTDSPPHDWQTLRSKKEARFRPNGRNIATNGHTDKTIDTNSDDITRLSSFELNSNAGFQMTHPNKANGMLAEAMDVAERHQGGNSGGGNDHLNNLVQYNRKLPAMRKLQQPPSTRAIGAAPQIHAMLMKKFFTPLECQPTDHNCLQEYYRMLHTGRNKAAAATAKQMDDFTTNEEENDENEDRNDDDINMNAHAFAFGGDHNDDGGDTLGNFNDDAGIDSVYNNADMANIAGDGGSDDDGGNEDNNASNDILMLLSGEQDVMKFLSWAMSHLYPYQRFANLSGNGSAEYYHPGMYNWKKLNLSGRLEPPMLVDEPHYVIVRREQLEEDIKPDTQYKGDPFIPPRGRKHNMPDLDALLNRYETFVPNRGKRDKIKDLFKYDDLFFPNRGKKQKPSKATTTTSPFNSMQWQRNCDGKANGVCGNRKGSIDNQVDESDDNKLTASPATITMRRMFSVLKKRWRSDKPYIPWPGSEVSSNNAGTLLGINFDKNSDDNLSNNYSDTVDGNLVGDGDSNANDDDDDFYDDKDAAVWIPYNGDSAVMLTSNQTIGNDQSVKSPIPQIVAAINTLNNNEDPVVMAARIRRIASTFGGAARVAANRLRSSSTLSQRQRQQKQRTALEQLFYNQQERAQLKQKQQLQQQSKAMLRNLNYHLRHEQQQKKRRAISQLSLASNQVRGNSNDLDLLPLRQLQQIQQKKDFNKPLTNEHLPLAWLQHMSMPQAHLKQEQLLGGIDGVAIGRNPPETANIDHIYNNI